MLRLSQQDRQIFSLGPFPGAGKMMLMHRPCWVRLWLDQTIAVERLESLLITKLNSKVTKFKARKLSLAARIMVANSILLGHLVSYHHLGWQASVFETNPANRGWVCLGWNEIPGSTCDCVSTKSRRRIGAAWSGSSIQCSIKWNHDLDPGERRTPPSSYYTGPHPKSIGTKMGNN